MGWVKRASKNQIDWDIALVDAVRIIEYFCSQVSTFVGGPMPQQKISVLLEDAEAARFAAYCKEKGFKKSSLIARLVREHLDREKYLLRAERGGQSGRKRGL